MRIEFTSLQGLRVRVVTIYSSSDSYLTNDRDLKRSITVISIDGIDKIRSILDRKRTKFVMEILNNDLKSNLQVRI